MAAKPGTATARVMFKTIESVKERDQDVKTTEEYANGLSDYDPRIKDWPGVDDAGADPQVEEWEVNNASTEVDLNTRVTRSAQKRGVIGYVNWYGDDVPEFDVTPKPFISWIAQNDNVTEFKLKVLFQGSVLYRGTWAKPFNAPLTQKWYTTALNSLPYMEKTGYTSSTTSHPKELAAYRVIKEADLIDMTDYGTVVKVMKKASGFRPDVVDAIKYGFKWADKSGFRHTIQPDADPDNPPADFFVIQRDSEAWQDNEFCEWFDVNFPDQDGWCFIKSAIPAKRELQKHHDEIYLKQPEDVLLREPYAIREKVSRVYQMAQVGWGPKNVIDLDDD